jgi:hypothetical protein
MSTSLYERHQKVKVELGVSDLNLEPVARTLANKIRAVYTLGHLPCDFELKNGSGFYL